MKIPKITVLFWVLVFSLYVFGFSLSKLQKLTQLFQESSAIFFSFGIYVYKTEGDKLESQNPLSF